MSVVSILILVMILSSVAFGCVLAWLFARKGLLGPPLQHRLERLEAEVRWLREGTRPDPGPELADEVRRLDEKVAFLENLLADSGKAAALPAADQEVRGPDRRTGRQEPVEKDIATAGPASRRG